MKIRDPPNGGKFGTGSNGFPYLSVSLDSNWLEIVHYAVFMADGIPVFQNANWQEYASVSL